MPDIRMHNGCSACGGSDLSVTTRGSLIEITCSICGHIEEVLNSRMHAKSLQAREAELRILSEEYWGEDSYDF
jgi:hypothetical protein